MSDAQRDCRAALLWWSSLLAAVLIWTAWSNRYAWQEAEGWEVEWIAQSLADGHGYSFPSNRRWLWQNPYDGPITGYFPTAWQEPAYPIVMAAAFKVFGSYYGKLVLVAAQSAFGLLTAILLYTFGRKLFGPVTGMVASLLFVLQPNLPNILFAHTIIAPAAGLLLVVSAWMLLWCVEAPSVKRAAGLGGVLGFGTLVSGPIVLLGLLATGVILLTGRTGWRPAWRPAAALAATAVVVCLPWVLRNYAVFGAFIPSRTGFGQIAHVGNPMLAETLLPGFRACPGSSGPGWTATSPTAAVLRMRNSQTDHRAMTLESFHCIERNAPHGYAEMNEAERDMLYAAEFRRFVGEHPGTFLNLLAHKDVAYFYTGWPRYLQTVALLALAGLVLGARRRQVVLLGAVAVAFSLPYTISMPYYDRYRYPVEPLLALLAASALTGFGARVLRLERRLGSEEGASRPTSGGDEVPEHGVLRAPSG